MGGHESILCVLCILRIVATTWQEIVSLQIFALTLYMIVTCPTLALSCMWNQHETASSWRVERGIWWFTVSNAVERFSRMTTEEEAALVMWGSSVTARRAVSVECLAQNQTGGGQGGCSGRDAKSWINTGRQLFLKWKNLKWKKRDRSVILYWGVECGFL